MEKNRSPSLSPRALMSDFWTGLVGVGVAGTGALPDSPGSAPETINEVRKGTASKHEIFRIDNDVECALVISRHSFPPGWRQKADWTLPTLSSNPWVPFHPCHLTRNVSSFPLSAPPFWPILKLYQNVLPASA